jgi:hypothetical protein
MFQQFTSELKRHSKQIEKIGVKIHRIRQIIEITLNIAKEPSEIIRIRFRCLNIVELKDHQVTRQIREIMPIST